MAKFIALLLCLMLTPASAVTLTDDRGAQVTLTQAPQRIITLLPSLAETVCVLGACNRLVGTDNFANWPDEVKKLPKLGGLEDTQIERSMVHLVAHMARQVVGRELRSDSRQITQVLREALKLLPMGADNIRIHLNPQDFELAKALRERHEESWKLLEDEALLPGGCRIETLHSRIDATMETRIEKAVAQLFDQLHDQALHPAAADMSVELDTRDAP
jgi:hypothetical protein